MTGIDEKTIEKVRKLLEDRLGVKISNLDKLPPLPQHISEELEQVATKMATDYIRQTMPKEMQDEFDAFIDEVQRGRNEYFKNIKKHEKLGINIIDAFYKSYEDGEKVDMMDAFATMCKAFLALVSMQSKREPRPKGLEFLTRSDVAQISTLLVNTLGNELAKKGLAVNIMDDIKSRKEMK